MMKCSGSESYLEEYQKVQILELYSYEFVTAFFKMRIMTERMIEKMLVKRGKTLGGQDFYTQTP